MPWKRRKNPQPWAYFAWVVLFLLAVAAPRGWQKMQMCSPPQQQAEVSAPCAQQATILAHPAEPMRENLPPVLAEEYDEEEYDEFVLAPTPAASVVPETFETVSGQIPAALPLPQEFSLESLLKVRDALSSLVNQAIEPKARPAEVVPTEVSLDRLPHRVRVSSSEDRLAMLGRHRPRRPARNRREDQITDPAELENQFAENLLNPQAVLRLAMKKPEPSEPLKQPEPKPAKQPLRAAIAIRYAPQALIQQLETLSTNTPASEWASQTLQLVRRLTQDRPQEDSADAWSDQLQTLTELQTLAAEGFQSALETPDPGLQYDWLQAAHGLNRRLEIWNALLDPTVAEAVQRANAQSDASTDLQLALSAAESWTSGSTRGAEWREYLLLDRIAAASASEAEISLKQRQQLARIVLDRMEDARLTTEQRQFLATQPLEQLRRGLRPWASGVVNLETLLALVERYDQTRETRFADAISEVQYRLRWSKEHRLNTLAEHLEQHYRGANMRVAVTDELLNRMMPSQQTKYAPVRGRIAGTKVRGRSKTSTQLRVRLVPDDHVWRFELGAFGSVLTQTKSDTWPARVRNKAHIKYHAQKHIVISPAGLQMAPTKATAEGSDQLLGVESQFDPVPLLGSWLRSVARERHSSSRSIAMRQAKSRVTQQAREQMDRKANPKLRNLENRFREEVLGPFEQLALVAEPIQMHTTERRAVMRLRLSSGDQLAAHTPRPSAPADSLISLQLHESALNNAVRGLDLDGRRITVGELFALISTKFGQADLQPPTDLPLRAVVQFALQDAVRIRCDADRIELLLSIDTLARGRDRIEGFQVHAFFRPQISGMQVTFVREGTLQFSGRRLRTGPRVVLHSIFGKLLRKDQQLPLLAEKVQEDARFVGLMVTQLVLQDGWLALAVGPEHPQRVAWREVGRAAIVR